MSTRGNLLHHTFYLHTLFMCVVFVFANATILSLCLCDALRWCMHLLFRDLQDLSDVVNEVYFHPLNEFRGQVNVTMMVTSLAVDAVSVINLNAPIGITSSLRGVSSSASGEISLPCRVTKHITFLHVASYISRLVVSSIHKHVYHNTVPSTIS